MGNPTGEPDPLDLDLADLDLGGLDDDATEHPTDGFDPRWRPLDHTWGENEPG